MSRHPAAQRHSAITFVYIVVIVFSALVYFPMVMDN